jgi:hypothetical protein
MHRTVTVDTLVFIQEGIWVRDGVRDALMPNREYGRWRPRRDGKKHKRNAPSKETPDERIGTR